MFPGRLNSTVLRRGVPTFPGILRSTVLRRGTPTFPEFCVRRYSCGAESPPSTLQSVVFASFNASLAQARSP